MQVAKQRGMGSGTIALLERAAIDAVLLPSRPQQVQFLNSGAPYGVFDRLVADGATRPAPLQAPIVLVTASFDATEHVPGAPIAVSKLALDDGELVRREVASICALTRELLQAVGTEAQALFSAELRSGIAKAVDSIVIPEILATAPVVTAAGFPAAVSAVLGALTSVTSSSAIYLLLPPTIALELSGTIGESGAIYPQLGPNGGAVGQLAALVTDELAPDEIAAVDAHALVTNVGEIKFDTARSAALQMSNAPVPGPQPQVSLWQANSVGLRSIRSFAFNLTNPGAVAKCTVTSP